MCGISMPRVALDFYYFFFFFFVGADLWVWSVWCKHAVCGVRSSICSRWSRGNLIK